MEQMNKENTKVALFGTGYMGNPMARHLLTAGYPTMVYNRSIDKTINLRDQGALVANDPFEAVAFAEVSLIMLADFPAIEAVFFKKLPQQDIWCGKTFIQMSTIAPGESLQIKSLIEAAGGDYIEAPVLGGIPKVEAGELFIFVGSTQKQFEKWDSLLALFGKNRFLVGDAGQAAAVKLAFNQLNLSFSTALSMSMGYLQEVGIDMDLFMNILRKSALYSKGLEKKSDKFRNREFETVGFPMKLMLKDCTHMVEQFKAKDIDVSPLQGIQKILKTGLERGQADDDGLSIYNIIHPKKSKG
jgi:3-hydroxyisobutyrate dehydrogenase